MSAIGWSGSFTGCVAGDVLELDVEGDWIEGVLSVGEFIGLVFHTPNFDKIESLESLSRRDARVRKVRR